jgi:bis(5'-nucleosyl)-tetraphosphatase (symmetrical)
LRSYAIGDLQGCAHEAGLLLEKISQDAGGPAHIYFVGDLINRGPESLDALRKVMALSKALGGNVDAVLGNHDLHLLAVAAGVRTLSRTDTLDDIMAAPDHEELVTWLRYRPLAIMEKGHLLVHAGLAPQWSVDKALALAGEVQQALRGPNWRDFLTHMYGNEPSRWDDGLQGHDRLRCIVNALTRLRLCSADGDMDFTEKESAPAPEGSPLRRWFDVPGRQSAGTPIVFGHWSALGLLVRDDIVSLDSGCVWGGHLTAVCLDDRSLLQVECPEHRAIKGKKK